MERNLEEDNQKIILIELLEKKDLELEETEEEKLKQRTQMINLIMREYSGIPITFILKFGAGKTFLINSFCKVDAGKTFKSNTKQVDAAYLMSAKQIIEGIKLRINAIELNIERENLLALEADSKLPKYIIEGIKLSAMDTGGTLHTGWYQVIRHDTARYQVIRHDTGGYHVSKHGTGEYQVSRLDTGGYHVSKHGTGEYQIAPVKLLTVQATILEDKEGAENYDEKLMMILEYKNFKESAISSSSSLNQNVRKNKKEVTNAETDCVSKEKNVFLAKLSRKNGRTSIEKLNDELKMLKFRDPNVRFKIRAIKALKHKLQADGHL